MFAKIYATADSRSQQSCGIMHVNMSGIMYVPYMLRESSRFVTNRSIPGQVHFEATLNIGLNPVR